MVAGSFTKFRKGPSIYCLRKIFRKTNIFNVLNERMNEILVFPKILCT